MDRWLRVGVRRSSIVAGIIAMVAFARGDPGHDDLPPAAIVAVIDLVRLDRATRDRVP